MKTVMVRRVRSIWHGRHQGSAALITTIAVSAILVVLFVGITGIATREIRQSIDSDNSNRALYAAEAGVEDALRRLGEDPNFREAECNKSSNGAEVKVAQGSNAPDTAWTCRTVTSVNKELTGLLNRDESLTINLSRGRDGIDEGSAGYRQAAFMKIEWNDTKKNGQTNPGPIAKASSWLPVLTKRADDTITTSWNGPAALEISAAWLPAVSVTGNPAQKQINPNNIFPAGVIPVRTVLASPVYRGEDYKDFSPWNTSSYPDLSINSSGVDRGGLASNVSTQCGGTTGDVYSCRMPADSQQGYGYRISDLLKTEINDGSQNNFVNGGNPSNNLVFLRIRPRYNAASYRIQFFDTNGNPVYMADGDVTIDVTARSNNYFRRVIAKKKVVPGAQDGIFDNALFSGKDICKTMKIYRDFRGAPDRRQNKNAGSNTGCDEG